MAKAAKSASTPPPPAGMFIIAGEELFMRNEQLARIREQIFGNEDPGMGLVRLDPATLGGDALAAILDEVRTPSMFAPKKLVVVDPADALFKASEDPDDPKRLGNREILENYLT